jgi:ABC-type dipeptide/oligopeptide/nickel transport system permease component
MLRFLLARLIRLTIVLVGVSLLSFLLLHLSGDPALSMLPPEATPQEVAKFRTLMGFDQPILVQYGQFLVKAVQGDFGRSLKFQLSSLEVIREFIPATLELSVYSMLVSILVAVPAGIASAVNRKSAMDSIFTALALLGQSIPIFFTGLILQIYFGVKWHMLPVSGWDSMSHMILPSITLGVWTAPVLVRLVRSAMVDVLSADYIRTARAKGMADTAVIYKHALKNAAIPIITVMGIQFGRLLGGSVITESVFAIPGLGKTVVDAIMFKDFPLVQASVFFLALVIVVLNFTVDLCYAWVNPQIRFS